MILVHPEAAAEAQAARAAFARRNPGAGHRFLVEYDRALDRIGENPERWPKYPYAYGLRWFHFKRFRYAVIYEIVHGAAFVLAVAPDRRRPGYWRKRRAASPAAVHDSVTQWR